MGGRPWTCLMVRHKSSANSDCLTDDNISFHSAKLKCYFRISSLFVEYIPNPIDYKGKVRTRFVYLTYINTRKPTSATNHDVVNTHMVCPPYPKIPNLSTRLHNLVSRLNSLSCKILDQFIYLVQSKVHPSQSW